MKTAFPFLAAIIMLSASSLIIKRAKHQVAGWINAAAQRAQVPDKEIPDYLAPQQVLVYVEYAADIGQIVPTVALTGIGVVASLPDSASPQTAAALTLSIVLALVLADGVLLTVSPHRYVRQKFAGLSAVPLVGIVVNAVAMAIMLVIS